MNSVLWEWQLYRNANAQDEVKTADGDIIFNASQVRATPFLFDRDIGTSLSGYIFLLWYPEV